MSGKVITFPKRPKQSNRVLFPIMNQEPAEVVWLFPMWEAKRKGLENFTAPDLPGWM